MGNGMVFNFTGVNTGAVDILFKKLRVSQPRDEKEAKGIRAAEFIVASGNQAPLPDGSTVFFADADTLKANGFDMLTKPGDVKYFTHDAAISEGTLSLAPSLFPSRVYSPGLLRAGFFMFRLDKAHVGVLSYTDTQAAEDSIHAACNAWSHPETAKRISGVKLGADGLPENLTLAQVFAGELLTAIADHSNAVRG